jgi:hypothetical protein
MKANKADSKKSDSASTGRHIRLFRDPRDTRELLTDVLGVTVDASVDDARDGLDTTPTAATNLLGRRKRERAWEELQNPVNRLRQEAMLYPIEPIPSPDDAEFPTYDPKLPTAPTIHDTAHAIEALLQAISEALPPTATVRKPTLREGPEPPLPEIPAPSFDDE